MRSVLLVFVCLNVYIKGEIAEGLRLIN